jgi:radical SAM superfamily enzyme YgiQ (UPF0313 family)
MKKRATKKLLLINPRNQRFTGLSVSRSNRIPPLGLGIVAALTPADWEVEIVDENVSPFVHQDADLVGLSADTASVTRAYELAAALLEAGIPTVIGGLHASMVPEEAGRYVDTVVVGEAEGAWGKVISDFEAGKMGSLYEGERVKLEGWPRPRHDLFKKAFFGVVQTARGCPMNCEFCSVTSFNGGQYRQRPIEEVLDELETVSNKFLFFADDNISPRGEEYEERAIALFEGMIKRKIKKWWWCQASLDFAGNERVLAAAARAGCQMVFMGIEAEDRDTLTDLNKKTSLRADPDHFGEAFDRIHKHGIAILGAFIYGTDSDTPEKLRRRTDYIRDCGVDSLQATVLTPLPGTRLFERLEKEGRLAFSDFPADWDHFNVTEVAFEPALMTREELWEEITRNWKITMNRPAIGRRAYRTLRSTGRPVAAGWGLGVNVKYRELAWAVMERYATGTRAFEGGSESPSKGGQR